MKPISETIFHYFARICALLTLSVNCFAAEGLTDWQGIANKNHVLRITHDDEYIYVSSSGAGITVINKHSGQQKTFNRANELSFDNCILDMSKSDDMLWASGRFYGFGKLSDTGSYKFDMLKAGCISSQWMQGILVESQEEILLGGLLAFYVFNGSECTYSYFFNELSPMSMVTDIKKTQDGDVFVSSYDWGVGGNSLYKYSDGELTPVVNPCNFINRMSVCGNTVWLASDGNGLVKLENGSFTEYNTGNSEIPDDIIADICTDSEGSLWMVSPGHLIKYSNGVFKSMALSDVYADENDRFTAVDADGSSVYAGTQYHGLLKLVDNGMTAVDLVDNPEFCNMTPVPYRGSSSMDSDGNFLMVSDFGLNIYDPVDREARIIPCTHLREVCVSPVNGDVWLRRADPDSCLVKIGGDRLAFSYETVPLTLGETFNIMAFDNSGNLWVATGDGLMRYDGKKWERFTEMDAGFPISQIKCIAVDSKNRLWCGAFGKNRVGNGLIMFDGVEWHNYKTSNSRIPSDFVGCINIDRNDAVWLNCRDAMYPEIDMYGYGLTFFDGENWITYDTSNSDICSDHIYSIEIDEDDTKWLATTGDRGVMSFDGRDWRLYSADNSGIALNTANDITIDRKNDLIWFVHPLGNGVSCAVLNTRHGSTEEVMTDFGESLIGNPLAIYNLQGIPMYNTPCYQGESLNLPGDIYIVATPEGTRKMYIK